MHGVKIHPSWEQQHEVFQSMESDDYWGSNTTKFSERHVIVVYSSEREKVPALIIARQVSIAAMSTRIVRQIEDEDIDFMRVVTSYPELPSAIWENNASNFAKLLEPSQLPVIHPMQEYFLGKIWYGFRLENHDYIVNSEGIVMNLISSSQEGFLLRAPSTEGSRLATSVVLRLISEPDFPSLSVLFEKLRTYIKNYIYLENNDAYDVLTLWVIGSYLFSIFRYYPYLHLQAEKGSGKTLLMEILASVSFNGRVLTNPNGSTVLKLIATMLPSIFIDEAEGLSTPGGKGELMPILNTGFSKTGLVVKGNRDYSTYNPKCFASIGDINDVLADRTIVVRMMRSTDQDQREIYREDNLALKEQAELREMLYVFGLRYGPKIAEIYRKSPNIPDMDISFLTTRAFDIWWPLISIVQVMQDDKLKQSILEHIIRFAQVDVRRRAQKDTDENETGLLVQAVADYITNTPGIEKDGNNIYLDRVVFRQALVNEGLIAKGVSVKALSRLLKRVLEIESKPRQVYGATKRYYFVDKPKLDEYQRRYAPTISNKV